MTTTAPAETAPARPPSFELSRRSRDTDLQAQLAGFPAALASLGGEAAERHAQLAHRYGAARSRLIALDQKIDGETAADAERARAAIAAGSDVPAAKATKIIEQRSELAREIAMIEEMIPGSAAELLATLQPLAAEQAERLDADAGRAELEAERHLEDALQAIAAAHSLRLASSWANQLAAGEPVRPYRSGNASSTRAGQAIEHTKLTLADERERRAKRRAEYEHELVALNSVMVGPGVSKRLPDPAWRFATDQADE